MADPQQDAFAYIKQVLADYGLPDTLSTWAWGEITNGVSQSQVLIDMQQRPEFTARFPGIAERQAAGYNAISVNEYLALENNYKKVLSSYGLPQGFYDTPQDFAKLIGGDVSANELAGRVGEVQQVIAQNIPEVRNALQNFYGISPDEGQLLAYALDPKVGQQLLDKQIRSAQVAGAAGVAGLQETQARSEQLVAQGVSQQQAQQGFSGIAQELKAEQYQAGAQTAALTQQQLEQEAFVGDAAVAAARRKRVQEAAGLFQAQGGALASQRGIGALGEVAG